MAEQCAAFVDLTVGGKPGWTGIEVAIAALCHGVATALDGELRVVVGTPPQAVLEALRGHTGRAVAFVLDDSDR